MQLQMGLVLKTPPWLFRKCFWEPQISELLEPARYPFTISFYDVCNIACESDSGSQMKQQKQIHECNAEKSLSNRDDNVNLTMKEGVKIYRSDQRM